MVLLCSNTVDGAISCSSFVCCVDKVLLISVITACAVLFAKCYAVAVALAFASVCVVVRLLQLLLLMLLLLMLLLCLVVAVLAAVAVAAVAVRAVGALAPDAELLVVVRDSHVCVCLR